MVRIGPKMLQATYICMLNPGCNKMFLAEKIIPEGGSITQHGYPMVKRAMEAGLIEGVKNGKQWSLRITPKGAKEIREMEDSLIIKKGFVARLKSYPTKKMTLTEKGVRE